MAAADVADPRSPSVCAGMGVDLVGKQLWPQEGPLRKEPHHLGTCSFDAELLLPRGHHGVEERGYMPPTSWLITSSMSFRLLVGKMRMAVPAS